VTTPAVTLPALGPPVDELWHVLLDLGERLAVPWTLVGGQMVLLHALEHGHVPPQISQDGDVIADIRAASGALSDVVAALGDDGFALEGIGPDGVGHRYVRPTAGATGPRRKITVDVLAPEGVGTRADLTTTPPGHTVQVPGGTQALDRTELVTVIHEGRSGTVPRPTLLGALVTKAAACGLPDDAARHLRDLTLLCALVDDPFAMRAQLTAKDRQRLGLAVALSDRGHQAWLLVPDAIRPNGQIAYAVLIEAL